MVLNCVNCSHCTDVLFDCDAVTRKLRDSAIQCARYARITHTVQINQNSCGTVCCVGVLSGGPDLDDPCARIKDLIAFPISDCSSVFSAIRT